MKRAQIVAEARSWLGTPYRHQASVRRVGADCLGLVRGVWRAVIGPEPEPPPPYSPDWAERGEGALLERAFVRWLAQPAKPEGEPGDVMIFRMAEDAPAKHAAILTETGTLIHAFWGRSVVESHFGSWWLRRFARAFSFPGAEPWRN